MAVAQQRPPDAANYVAIMMAGLAELEAAERWEHIPINFDGTTAEEAMVFAKETVRLDAPDFVKQERMESLYAAGFHEAAAGPVGWALREAERRWAAEAPVAPDPIARLLADGDMQAARKLLDAQNTPAAKAARIALFRARLRDENSEANLDRGSLRNDVDFFLDPNDTDHITPGAATQVNPWRWADVSRFIVEEAPAQRWIFRDLLPRQTVAQLAAPSGLGKTWTLLSWIVGLATGRTVFRSFVPDAPMRVMAFLGEDPDDEIHRRLRRILSEFELTETEQARLAENLSLACGQAQPLMQLNGGNPAPSAQYLALRDAIKTKQPDLVILDPQARFYGLEENSNDHASYFIARLQELADLGECTVLLTHHVSKQAQVTRGATAFRDGARWAAEMRELTEKDARVFRLNPQQTFRYIELTCTKSSYSARPAPIYFERLEGGALVEVQLHREDGGGTPGPDFLLDVVTALAAELEREPVPMTAQDIFKYDRNGVRTRVQERLKPSRVTRVHIEQALALGVSEGVIHVATVTGANRKPTKVYSFVHEV